MTSSGKSSKTSGDASSMNMSGMAGLGVTDPNWKYTGPALPAAEVARVDHGLCHDGPGPQDANA